MAPDHYLLIQFDQCFIIKQSIKMIQLYIQINRSTKVFALSPFNVNIQLINDVLRFKSQDGILSKRIHIMARHNC